MNTDVVIVAGGPSLKDFDWHSLKYKQVIAINNAALRLPYARHVYFANRDWFDKWEVELMLHAGQIHQGTDGEEQWVSRPWVRRWDFTTEFDQGIHPGACSGNAALWLAYHLGYRHFTLLGYDFTTGNFHNDHIWTNHQPETWKRWFERFIPELQKRGVTISHPEWPSPSRL